MGGGLRDIVPCPSGILAVGDGDLADLLLFERTSETASGCTGVAGTDAIDSAVGDVMVGDVAAIDATGVTGFIRSPLIPTGTGSGDWARRVGAGGRTFSR